MYWSEHLLDRLSTAGAAGPVSSHSLLGFRDFSSTALESVKDTTITSCAIGKHELLHRHPNHCIKQTLRFSRRNHGGRLSAQGLFFKASVVFGGTITDVYFPKSEQTIHKKLTLFKSSPKKKLCPTPLNLPQARVQSRARGRPCTQCTTRSMFVIHGAALNKVLFQKFSYLSVYRK